MPLEINKYDIIINMHTHIYKRLNIILTYLKAKRCSYNRFIYIYNGYVYEIDNNIKCASNLYIL